MIMMHNNGKKKEQLINELQEMRKRVVELEKEKAVWNQTMKAIRAIEANYGLLLSLSAESDAIVIVDARTQQIVDANDSALKLYGYSREEFLRLKAIELSAKQKKSIEHIKKVAREKPGVVSPGPVQRLHKKKDGTIFPVEISSGVFTLQDRKMICAIFRGITKHKQAEEELRQSEAVFRTIIDITEQNRAEKALALERDKLQGVLAKRKNMNGMLPICASCKKIRDDKGYWNQIEKYISDHFDIEFSHSICPECITKIYPDLESDKR